MALVPLRSVLVGARAYVSRVLVAHLAGWVAGIALALAVVHHAHARWINGDASEIGVQGGALLGTLGVVAAGTYFGHRWALGAALERVLGATEWVDWVVARLLERATGDDRRGRKAVKQVVGLVGGETTASRLVQFALARVGATAVVRVAETLNDAILDDRPIGERVRESLLARLAHDRHSAGLVLAGLLAAVIAGSAFYGLHR